MKTTSSKWKADYDMSVGVRGMKERSFLEQAMRQSVLVGRRLGETVGDAGLVDVRRVWEEKVKEVEGVKVKGEPCEGS